MQLPPWGVYFVMPKEFAFASFSAYLALANAIHRQHVYNTYILYIEA